MRPAGGAKLTEESLCENGRFKIVLVVILQRASFVQVVTQTLGSKLLDFLGQVFNHFVVLVVIHRYGLVVLYVATAAYPFHFDRGAHTLLGGRDGATAKRGSFIIATG